MRVLSLPGKGPASRSGPAVSTLIRKVPGLRRYCPARFLGEAAMTNAGSLGRDAALHIPACVRSRHGALWQAAFHVAAHGAVDAHKDHEKDVGAEAAADATVEKRLMPTTGHGRRLSPQAAGVRRDSALTSNVVRLIARRGHVPGGSCGLRGSAARLSPSRS
jgi:hypothetical protein